MKFRGESGPGLGDQLLDEMETGHSHGGNGTYDANDTRETTEENTSVVEETPILSDPEGASDDALFGVDNNRETAHGDEDEPVLYENGKRIETLETKQTIKRKNMSKKKPDDTGKASPKSNENLGYKVERILYEVTKSVNDTDLISAELIREAMEINNEAVNHLLLNIPSGTLVYFDKDKIYTRTIDEIRENPELLKETLVVKPEKIAALSIMPKKISTKPINRNDDSEWGGSELSRSIFNQNPTERPNITPSTAKPATAYINRESHEPQEKIQTQIAIPPAPVTERKPNTQPETQRESRPSNLEGLFNIAETKDDLIAIIAKSTDLEDGLQGTHQVYSKDDLIALIEATWTGEVGIDHLPRTAGFRDNVDRIRENERYHLDSRIAKQKTAEELAPAMQATIEMENELGVPEDEQIYGHNQEDNSFVYNYTNYPRTEKNRKKNTNIFGRLWNRLRGKK